MYEEMTALPNIGKDTARQLHEVGVRTPDDLRAMGAKEAWLRILATDPSACVNRLQGLEGAVRGLPKRALPQAVKEDLKQFVRTAKGG